MAPHPIHCTHLHFMLLSPLVISISWICLTVWDSLVNTSHDKQPISPWSLDYVFRVQCISIQQYVISACVVLRWQLWAFNKNSIKNDAGHGAEGRAAKSQLKHIQIHLCRLIMKTLLCLVIEFYYYALQLTRQEYNRPQTQLPYQHLCLFSFINNLDGLKACWWQQTMEGHQQNDICGQLQCNVNKL